MQRFHQLVVVFYIGWLTTQVSTTVDKNGINQGAKKHNSSNPAFSAWKQSTQIYNVSDVITFEGVLLNVGNHYSPLTSRFTCPVGGIYFVTMTLKKYQDWHHKAKILKESENILTIRFSPNFWVIATNSAIVRCAAGESIWAQAFDVGGVFGDAGIPESTFSVILMHQGAELFTHDLSESSSHTNFIGSTVWTSTDQEYGKDEIITFENSNFNEGGHFKLQFNRFECPITGVYYVTLHLHKYSTNDLNVGVERDSAIILHLEDNENENIDNLVSNSFLITCDAGDFISVKGTAMGQTHGPPTPRSIFSVMLLYEGGTSKLHSEFIGFSAWKKSSQQYITGDTITFEGVLLNYGDHYNPLLSRFVCPVTGVYFVAITCKKFVFTDQSLSNLQVDVLRETQTILRLNDMEATNPGVMVTNSAVIDCSAGEDIVVKGSGLGQVYGDPSKALTTFTIFMVNQD